MPLYEHENWGDIQDHTFMKGTITAITSSDDTADVTISGAEDGSGIPIFYHCEPDSEERSNGAIEGAAGGFSVDDEVIVMCTVDGEPVRIVGLVDGIKACGFIVQITCMLWCVVWDFMRDDYATGVTWNEPDENGDTEPGHPLNPDYQNGGIVSEFDWPVNTRFISQWAASKEVDPNAEDLFSMDWDADPTRARTNTYYPSGVSECGDSGYAPCTVNGFGYFWEPGCYPWWNTYYLGKTDTMLTCDDKTVSPNTRTWDFLGRHVTSHFVNNREYESRVNDFPGQEYWYRIHAAWGSVDRRFDTWSGQLLTALNESGAELEFFRHVVDRYKSWTEDLDVPYPFYSFARSWIIESSFSSAVGYTIPEVTGGHIFEIEAAPLSESSVYACNWVSTEDAWDQKWDCTGQPLTQTHHNHPIASFDAMKPVILVGGQRIEGAPMMGSHGKFNTSNDYMVAGFGRLRSEDWETRDSDLRGGATFKYEAWIGFIQGDGGSMVSDKDPTMVLEHYSRVSGIVEDMMEGRPPKDYSGVLPDIYPTFTVYNN